MMNSNERLLILNDSQIDEFHKSGVLVIPSIITDEEIDNCRNGFHDYLLKNGCNIRNLEDTSKSLSLLSSTNGSGGVLDVFYEDWKLCINEHPNVVSVLSDLWENTYAKCEDGIYHHPYGPFDSKKGYMYIDRVCFRLPDKIAIPEGTNKRKALQRSLTPHLDCCPHKLYNSSTKEFPKWRPIQAFVSLTDTLEPNHGGFEACTGLHAEFDDWIQRRSPSIGKDNQILEPPCVGEFTPIRAKEDKDIIERFKHIPCKKGDMICWDYRIPHANSRHNLSSISREAVYIGLLPHIDMNRRYAEEQLKRFNQGLLPQDQWHENQKVQSCAYQFSTLGSKLMTITNW